MTALIPSSGLVQEPVPVSAMTAFSTPKAIDISAKKGTCTTKKSHTPPITSAEVTCLSSIAFSLLDDLPSPERDIAIVDQRGSRSASKWLLDAAHRHGCSRVAQCFCDELSHGPEIDVSASVPNSFDLAVLIVTLHQYPLGGFLLVLLVLAVVAGIFAWRWQGRSTRRGKRHDVRNPAGGWPMAGEKVKIW
jgi:hypothetical protein